MDGIIFQPLDNCGTIIVYNSNVKPIKIKHYELHRKSRNKTFHPLGFQ
jgi:hypothetical protein